MSFWYNKSNFPTAQKKKRSLTKISIKPMYHKLKYHFPSEAQERVLPRLLSMHLPKRHLKIRHHLIQLTLWHPFLTPLPIKLLQIKLLVETFLQLFIGFIHLELVMFRHLCQNLVLLWQPEGGNRR